jgi:acyl-CoA thioesterase
MHEKQSSINNVISFNDVISWKQHSDFSWQGYIQKSWMQGRSAFGGIPTGVVLRALQTQCDLEKQQRPLSMSISFLAPIIVGSAVLHLRCLRKGKYIEHWEGEIVQEEKIKYRFMATLGFDRKSPLLVSPPQPPQINQPSHLFELPYIENVTPAFTQHYEYRWAQNYFPFSGSKESGFCGWIRPRTKCDPSESLIASLLDAWPPPILLRAKRPTPASTISWHIHFVQPITQSTWWIYQAQTQVAHNGYSNMTDFLWDENKKLIAQSQQVIAEFSSSQ